MTLLDIYAAFIAPAILLAGAYALVRFNRYAIGHPRRTPPVGGADIRGTNPKRTTSARPT